MNKDIRNIIFDLGGVLVGLDGERCIRAFAQIGCDAIADYVAEHRTEDLFLEIERGLITVPQFCDEVRRISRCTATDSQIVWAWNELLTTIPDSKKERLLRLRAAGYRLFLLSNTNEMHWQRACRLLEYRGHTAADYFDKVYLSNEMHLVKPDTAIYAAVLDQSGLAAGETLFIDDREVNLAAAAQLGIHTFHERPDHRWEDLLTLD